MDVNKERDEYNTKREISDDNVGTVVYDSVATRPNVTTSNVMYGNQVKDTNNEGEMVALNDKYRSGESI